MRKLFVFLISAVVTMSASASSMIFRVHDYRCSNGQQYHVVSEHRGGYGVSSWSIAAFCSDNIMTNTSYNGYSMSPAENRELNSCQDQVSVSVAICYDEYRTSNDQEGRGTMPAIVHGQ